jgi:hypothetical protein
MPEMRGSNPVEKTRADFIIRKNFINKAQIKKSLGYEYINLPKEFSLNDTIEIFCSAHNKLFFAGRKIILKAKDVLSANPKGPLARNGKLGIVWMIFLQYRRPP